MKAADGFLITNSDFLMPMTTRPQTRERLLAVTSVNQATITTVFCSVILVKGSL